MMIGLHMNTPHVKVEGIEFHCQYILLHHMISIMYSKLKIIFQT